MIDVCLVPPVEDDLWFVPRTAWAVRSRTDAVAIVRAAIDAAAPGPLVKSALVARPLRGHRVIIIAAGKAASAMAAAAVDVLGRGERAGVDVRDIGAQDTGTRRSAARATGRPGIDVSGIIVAPARGIVPVPGLETFEAGHPLPDASSVAAAHAVQRILAGVRPSDEVLVLMSGGASAMLALPAGDVTIEDYAALTSLLLERGADIHAVNTVRKHVDALKGGQLARLAAPAQVRALVLSDVVGDALDTIASGPVTADATSYADAIRVLHHAGAWAGMPERARRHLERGEAGDYVDTPKPGDPVFANVVAQVIGNNGLARAGAAERARSLGYDVVMLDAPIVGEARDAGAMFARRALDPRMRAGARRIVLIAGGETTVTLQGNGRGGRNQELALAAAIELAGQPDVLVASFGTDGIDGATSVAGAVADGESVARAGERGVDARAYLNDNDAFGFFGCLHDLLLTGPTGTNVLDVQIALVGAAAG